MSACALVLLAVGAALFIEKERLLKFWLKAKVLVLRYIALILGTAVFLLWASVSVVGHRAFRMIEAQDFCVANNITSEKMDGLWQSGLLTPGEQEILSLCCPIDASCTTVISWTAGVVST